MSTYLITTTNQRRRSHWQRIFGTDRLPVLSPAPREISVPGGRAGRGAESPRVRMVYDLDVARLHPGQLSRLAYDVARSRCGRMPSVATYTTTLAEMRAGCWIEAEDTELVQAPPAKSWRAWLRERWRAIVPAGVN